MASKGDRERENKIQRIVELDKEKRNELKMKIRDSKYSNAERLQFAFQLNKMRKMGSAVKLRNRCSITGRSRGYYGFFGLGRHALRKLGAEGRLPGLTKASW